MRVKLEWVWERLDESTWRAKVIGGWIVNHVVIDKNKPISESMVFIPDSEHGWMIRQPVAEVVPMKNEPDFLTK